MAGSNWWRGPNWPWQLKAARAMHHINDLAAEINAYLARATFDIVPEPGGQPGETVYRLYLSEPIPPRFSVIMGDALHNLRSSLDCAASEIGRRYVDRTLGRALTEREEHDCEFPIYGNPAELQGFFNSRNRPNLYGPQEREAICSVQPGWGYDDQIRQGRTLAYGRDEEVNYHPLTLLNRLSNIDKHRRLNPVTSWIDLVYWGTDGQARRGWRWGTPPFESGSILGVLIGDPSNPEPLPRIQGDPDFRVLDPPEASSADITGLLTNMHTYISYRVLPRILYLLFHSHWGLLGPHFAQVLARGNNRAPGPRRIRYGSCCGLSTLGDLPDAGRFRYGPPAQPARTPGRPCVNPASGPRVIPAWPLRE
jgi:hypothetical protein